MKAHDLMELAGRNLREAVLRNSLTTLGISVGVASLVAMLSLGIGLQQMATKRLGRSGLFDTIFVSSRQEMRTREDRVQRSSQIKPLDDSARRTIEKLPGVTEANPDIRAVTELRFVGPGKQVADSHFGMIAGLPGSARSSEAFDDLQGDYFSAPSAEEAIIMGGFGRELLDLPNDPVRIKLTAVQVKQLLGKEITIRYAERQQSSSGNAATGAAPDTQVAAEAMDFSVVRKERVVKIIGILESEPFGGMRASSQASVFVPIGFAEMLNIIQPTDLRSLMRPAKGKTYQSLSVRVTKPGDVSRVEEEIKKQGFFAFSMLDASKNISRFFALLDSFLGIFGSLALAVASLGIVNTLVMAILERRREIGIMKALGASDGDVKRLFFVEAGCLGIVGGALGVLLGWLIGKAINFGTNIYLSRHDIPNETFWSVPWWLVAGALGFSIVVSLVSGLYPASRAARLDPVQALRHD